LRAQNINGENISMDTEGLLAICIQHEIDHLDGKLFVDYLSNLKQNRLKKRISKIELKESTAN
jgi:peptide deformylase